MKNQTKKIFVVALAVLVMVSSMGFAALAQNEAEASSGAAVLPPEQMANWQQEPPPGVAVLPPEQMTNWWYCFDCGAYHDNSYFHVHGLTRPHILERIEPTRVTLTPGYDRTMRVGDYFYLGFRIAPSNANSSTGVTFTSSNFGVVSVDSSGFVEVLSPGTVRITIRTQNNRTSSIHITAVDRDQSNDSNRRRPNTPDRSHAGQYSSLNSPSLNVPVQTRREAISTDVLLNAVRATSGRNVNLRNFSHVSADSLRAVAGEGDRRLQFDTMNGSAVTGRLTINPANAQGLTGDIRLGVFTTAEQTQSVQIAIDRRFVNKERIIYVEQPNFNMEVTIAALVGNFDANRIRIYSCDSLGQNIREVNATGITMDANGYVHFNTTVGGFLIVSEGPIPSQYLVR